jgi:hypothetical protein
MNEWHIPSLWHTDLDTEAGASEQTFPPIVTPKWKTAFHEAAHSVACFRLFHRLDFVTIAATSEYRGLMHGNKDDWQERPAGMPDEQRKAHIAKLCTITLSGGAAVEKLLGSMRGVEMSEDIAALRELLESVAETEEEMDRFTDRCWGQARRLVREEWDAIRAVASALKKEGTLTGEEVEEIMGKVEHQRTSKSTR